MCFGPRILNCLEITQTQIIDILLMDEILHHLTSLPWKGRIATPAPPDSMLAREEVVQDFGPSTCFTFRTVVAPMLTRENPRAARKLCAKWRRILSINSSSPNEWQPEGSPTGLVRAQEEEWSSVARSCSYFGPILPIFRFLDKDDEAWPRLGCEPD